MKKRSVIVHFHLFKNAGTSIDKVLKDNFKERWVEVEGPHGKKLESEALADFILANPQYDVFSSHTAVVKIPKMENVDVIPILYFRHPIDRIRSAYEFERKQDVQTPGAIKAKEGDFELYMNWRLSTASPFQVSNFHAARLKDFHVFTPARQRDLFLPRAIAAIDALPFIGLVESFDFSMRQFECLIKPHFKHFKASVVRENVTADLGLSLEKNLEKFNLGIGDEAYKTLLSINEHDFELYSYVKEKFHSSAVKA